MAAKFVLVAHFAAYLSTNNPPKTKVVQVQDGVEEVGAAGQGECITVPTYTSETASVTADDLIGQYAEDMGLFVYGFKPGLKKELEKVASEWLKG